MYRVTSFLAFLLLIPAMGCGAQVAEEAAHVYEAYYKIRPGDLPEWNRQYFKYAVPVLDGLVSSGVIEGYNQWEHTTGGEYNVRMAIRTYDWGAIDDFTSSVLSAMEEQSPEDFRKFMSITQGHSDVIYSPTRQQGM